MRPFKFTGPTSPGAAIAAAAANSHAKFLAGGTNLLDLMKEDVERPDELIHVSALPFTRIERAVSINGNGVSIGGMASNTDTANHPWIRKDFPLLYQAITAGAAAQLRNMEHSREA